MRLLKTALPRNEWTNASVATGVTEPVMKTHLIPQIDGKQKSESCRHLVSDHESTPARGTYVPANSRAQ